MTLNEKAAYIKGLADGLKLDENKPEVKIINEILNLLTDVTSAITSVENLYDDLSMQVDEIDSDLAQVEDYIYDDKCDLCDNDSLGLEDEDNPDYEVKCPDCGAKIVVDEDTLLEGEIACPNCGNTLEFDFSSIFADEECSCGDPDCSECNK